MGSGESASRRFFATLRMTPVDVGTGASALSTSSNTRDRPSGLSLLFDSSLCKLIFAFEALYPAGGIHYLLFAGEEWMALAT